MPVDDCKFYQRMNHIIVNLGNRPIYDFDHEIHQHKQPTSRVEHNQPLLHIGPSKIYIVIYHPYQGAYEIDGKYKAESQ